MPKPKIIIIGGGPAGLMAAIEAARSGAAPLVLEKMRRPGRKLCITGKGRCNITNIAEIPEFLGHFGKSGKFLRQTFGRFFNNDLIDFLEELGVKLVTERGGRVFPASGKAPDVLKALLTMLKQLKVEIRPSAPVDRLLIKNHRISGVVCHGKEIFGDAVILTTGGASYPATGSTGDGYPLAAEAGHTIIPIRPALVPLETAGNLPAKMADLNLRNIKVRMFINNKKRHEAFGELLFTKFGLSGPVVLTLSGAVVDGLRDGHKIEFALDLKPALDEKKLDARLQRDFAARGREELSSILRGLLPKEMVPVCLGETGIPPQRPGNRVSAKERRCLRNWLKDFRLKITKHRPISEAIVTAGGVDIREIDPRTMESRLTKGLFIAGELLDIQADTGGYNLQAAFSTGWLAGRSAHPQQG